jgi:predicted amidohydrolase YtcJ
MMRNAWIGTSGAALLVLSLLPTTSGGCAFTPADPARSAPDTIFVNGKIATVDAAFSIVQAVAVEDGRFVLVGTNDEVRPLAGPETRVVDLGGRLAVPGLADGHFHNAGGGRGVDLSRTRTFAEVLEAIRTRVTQAKPGDIVVTNSDWHEAQLAENRLPYRRDLDRIAPSTPVVVVRGGHEYILNSAALARWNITRATKSPEGGQISRYPDGEPNGELIDTAKSLVTLPAPPRRSIDERMAAMTADFGKLHAAGLTSIRVAGGSADEYRLFEEMKRRGLLTMRVSVLIRPTGATDEASVRTAVESWKLEPGEGDDWLRVDGIKLGVDGGFEGGWMREPYDEPYGQGGRYRGIQTMPSERYTAIVRAFNTLGWRVSTHAVGDAAIDLVLDAYEAADKERPLAGRRWVIEHGFIPRSDQFGRMKQLGLVISAQNHLYLAGPSLVRYWGAERAGLTTPVRSYLDQGLVVAGGTDAPVVPYPPLWTIYHFVTRDTISGGVLGVDQKISREDALRLSTINNARLTFQEEQRGSIETGKLADLTVLSADILTVPDAQIEQASAVLTMVGGTIVYAAAPFSVK